MNAIDSLQTTLAAEHAAIYLYGVLGGQTSQDGQPALFAEFREGYLRHQAQRAALVQSLEALGATPVVGSAVYALPAALDADPTEADIRAVGIDLEDACATTYSALVANVAGPQRRAALRALTEAAVAIVRLGGSAQAFPGAADLDA